MAKLSAHGTELARYFSPARRCLMSMRSDGVTLARGIYSPTWHLASRLRPGASLDQWRENKLAAIRKLPAWAQRVKSLPTLSDLEEFAGGISETTDGERIEPDGIGRDGAPSWLVALGMI